MWSVSSTGGCSPPALKVSLQDCPASGVLGANRATVQPPSVAAHDRRSDGCAKFFGVADVGLFSLRITRTGVSVSGTQRGVCWSFGTIRAMASTDPAKTGDQEVFGSLPDSRPTRRSAKRAPRTTTATPPRRRRPPPSRRRPRSRSRRQRPRRRPPPSPGPPPPKPPPEAQGRGPAAALDRAPRGLRHSRRGDEASRRAAATSSGPRSRPPASSRRSASRPAPRAQVGA